MNNDPKTLTPQRFRKKPVVAEAIQWTGWYDDATGEKDYGNADEVAKFMGVKRLTFDHDPSGEFSIAIKTLEGTMHADYKDFIIRGVKGEFYPCKPDIFAATYEPEGVPVVARDDTAELVEALEAYFEASDNYMVEQDGYYQEALSNLRAVLAKWKERS